MLARITYGLVGLALVSLIVGILQKENNNLLYVSIGLSVAAIVVILLGAARRAREVPGAPATIETGLDEELELAPGAEEAEEEIPSDLLAAFEDEEEEEEEELEALADEEPELAPRPAARKRAARTKATSRAAPTKAAATRATTKTAAAKTAPSKSRTAAKVVVVPGRDRYHNAECRFAQRDDVEEVTLAAAKRRGYQPCSACKPPA